jgi:phosphoribosylformylglycinamidine synthase
VCERWDVRATELGVVTDTRRLRVFDGDELVGDMPVEALVDDCPLYDLAPEEPSEQIYAAPKRTLHSDDPAEILLALLGSSNLSSRRPLFEQYDSIVQSRTVRRPESADAAVLQLAHDTGGGKSAIAVSIDGNGRRVACDPYWGTVEAVLECGSNLACVGAEPLGLTNCLNFGNPEKPHVAWQLTRSVDGMSDALRELGVPVVGGNVSLYNQSGDGPIYPTPVVGMVGLLPDASRTAGIGFVNEGDVIAMVGTPQPSLAGSELAKLRGEPLPTSLPAIDVAKVRAHQEVVRDAVRAGELASAHDMAEGGFLVAIAESCLAGGVGAALDFGEQAADWSALEPYLFGEAVGGFIVSGSPEAIGRLGERVPMDVVGAVGGNVLSLGIGRLRLAVPASDLESASMSLSRLV